MNKFKCFLHVTVYMYSPLHVNKIVILRVVVNKEKKEKCPAFINKMFVIV